jgi:hypothetical protein
MGKEYNPAVLYLKFCILIEEIGMVYDLAVTRAAISHSISDPVRC